MAVGAYPFLQRVSPTTFLKALAIAEMGLGVALLAPFVPNRLAGASLTAFLRGAPHNVPTDAEPAPAGERLADAGGIGMSKDVWMLGVGIGLLQIGSRPHS